MNRFKLIHWKHPEPKFLTKFLTGLILSRTEICLQRDPAWMKFISGRYSVFNDHSLTRSELSHNDGLVFLQDFFDEIVNENKHYLRIHKTYVQHDSAKSYAICKHKNIIIYCRKVGQYTMWITPTFAMQSGNRSITNILILLSRMQEWGFSRLVPVFTSHPNAIFYSLIKYLLQRFSPVLLRTPSFTIEINSLWSVFSLQEANIP